jgi:hypothetical protein
LTILPRRSGREVYRKDTVWGFKSLRLPALKRMIIFELFPATLKRCFPLLKQRALTNLTGGGRWEERFSPSETELDLHPAL